MLFFYIFNPIFGIRLTGCSVARSSRLLWEQEVAGSNPATPTKTIQKLIRDVAQPGSAHAWGAWGRRFKSCHPDFNTLKTLVLKGFFYLSFPTSPYQSQFCILYDEAEWLENTATVFGVLYQGQDVLALLEQAGMESEHIDPVTHTPTRDAAKSPYRHGGESHPLTITDCGQLILKVIQKKLNGKPHFECEWVPG